MFHIQKLQLDLERFLKYGTPYFNLLNTFTPANQINSFNGILDRLFIHVNLSILAGEYAEDFELTKAEIENAKDSLSGLLNFAEFFVTNPLLLKLSYNAVKIIENSLTTYESLTHRFRQITHPELKSSYLYNDDDLSEIENYSRSLLSKHNKILYDDFNPQKTLEAYKILIINVHLAALDLNCKPSQPNFHRLEYIENTLADFYSEPEFTSYEFIFVLIQKAKFLKLKIVIRFCQEQKEFGSNLNIVQNSTIKTIQDLIDGLEFEKLKTLLKYSFCHYIETDENDLEILNHFKASKLEVDSYQKRHISIKFYKDIKPDVKELEKVVDQFENDVYPDNEQFNIYANNVCVNYANNNLFSYRLEHDKKIDYEEVLNCYSRVQKVRNATKINNYFPELRFLKYLTNQLKTLLDGNNVIEDSNLINIYLNKCDELIFNYKNNINWTKYNHSYIFQLPFNECLIENRFTKKAGLRHLFISSSMILPLNIDNYYKEQESYANQITVYNSIKNTINNLKIQSKKLDKEIELNDKKDIKFIEILGLFCAISIFVSASILSFMGTQLDNKIANISNSSKTLRQEYYHGTMEFVISTGAILCAFLGLLIVIFNRKTLNRGMVLALVIMLILLIATCNNINS